MREIDEILKRYYLYDAIDAECRGIKNVPYSVKKESNIYRKHIFHRIHCLRDKVNTTDAEKHELEELNRCIKLISERESALFDSDFD